MNLLALSAPLPPPPPPPQLFTFTSTKVNSTSKSTTKPLNTLKSTSPPSNSTIHSHQAIPPSNTTRTRQCNGKQEISVLDYIFVTSDIYEQVRSIEIDEKNFFTLCRKLRKGRRFSDHHAIKLCLNLEFSKSPKRVKKLVVWNFDDPLNWKSFHQRTKISDDLQKAWKTKNNVDACYKQWKHSILYCMSASPKGS